ncbi:MAG TPA: wax ester/triacylglycerol synthase family O-acyltransferase, partial [Actinomycetota bacterium]|nr:wax ester/triacylglycerol synthase family O-acyltransferase [Actinomycetota bacterium]
MDRLSTLDDLFVVLERDNLPMHIGSLLIFEGDPPAYDELLEHVSGRLDRLPRYRQVIREVPFNIGMPTWEDDQHFNLEYHVRHTAVPA